MTNAETTTDALKGTIKVLETSLQYHTDEIKIKEIILEVERYKDRLISEYKDLTYSTAMSFNDYEAWLHSQGTQMKHNTGIAFIDEIFGGEGIQEETFVNLVGESGAGKSTLGIKILLNVAKNQKVYFSSLEMGRFKTYNKISDMIETSSQRENLHIDIWTDDLDKTLRNIELYAHNGCKFFLIDSKMKINVKGNEPTHEKISKMSSALSKLTQKLGIIIILINQISEEDMKNKRVTLKGSGDQKFDTDLLLSVEFDKKNEGHRILNVVKNRQNDMKPSIKYNLSFNKTDVNIGTEDNPIELEMI